MKQVKSRLVLLDKGTPLEQWVRQERRWLFWKDVGRYFTHPLPLVVKELRKRTDALMERI